MSSQKHFWIYGRHSVENAVKNRNNKITKIIINNSKKKFEWFKDLKVIIDPDFLKKNFKNLAHQGIAAEIIKPKDLKINLNELNKKKNILVLDGINDIRNIGSIFRSAFAFNFKDIIINKKDYNHFDPNLYKTASGSIENLNVYNVTNVKYEINELKKRNFQIFGFDSNNGESIIHIVKKINNENLKFVFIFGSEQKGIRPIVKKYCDQTVKINMSSKANSLNVSNAASIAMAIYYNSNF